LRSGREVLCLEIEDALRLQLKIEIGHACLPFVAFSSM